MKRLIVGGAGGKMGKTVISLAEKNGFSVVAGVDVKFKEQKCNAETACEYPLNEDDFFKYNGFDGVSVKGDVIIDFSSPEGSLAALNYATRTKTPIVIAATGLSENDFKAVYAAAKVVPVVYSENYSLGVLSFIRAAKTLAAPLSGYDFYIEEIHHSQKKDAPSGTAELLKREVESVIDKNAPVFSLRGGDIKGIHSLYVLGKNEMIELKHTAYSREIFAEGALRAADRIINKPPKLYSLSDLI